MKGINIQITAECDLRCPWCIEEESLCEHSGVISKQNLEHLMCDIIKDRYDMISLQGGEPLLYPEHLLEIITAIRKELPHTKIQILTNGTHLTEELVTIFNDINAHLVISLEAEGYKGIKFLINNAKEPEKTLQNINALRSKQIRSVAKDITNFAQDALMLHVIFPRSIIEVTPDFNQMVSYTESDIQGMKKEILKIKQKSHDVKNWLLIPRAFYGHCDVQSYKYLFAEDKIINDCPNKIPSGCAILTRSMPDGIYEKYRQAVKETLECHYEQTK